MSEAARVFLAATGQNRGKTTTSLGLIAAILRRRLRLGFIKPLGQRYLTVGETRADEDAMLMKEVFDLPDGLEHMSPVTLPPHFTTDYVMGRISNDLEARVTDAYRRVAAGKDLVVIEGTGHAGVGAVVGLSNARVAALLDAKVIVVSEGGVGRPIDEIALNLALFREHGVEVIGAVVNKVDSAARPDLPEILRSGLSGLGVELLGCIGYSELLANPSLELLALHLEGELLAGRADPHAIIGGVRIGAMRPEHALPRLTERTLLITPGDREDMQLAALEANRSEEAPTVIGMVLTGGFRPPEPVLERLRAEELFTFLVDRDTYATAQAVDELLVKTHSGDTEKIETIIDLVGEALDFDALLARIT